VLPFVVWLIHGSIDWFWEMPALTGPALAFLAMAGSLGARRVTAADPGAETGDPIPRLRLGRAGRSSVPRPPSGAARRAGVAVAAAAALAAFVVLTFPYLSVIEQARADRESGNNPVTALNDLATAASLNPLTSLPGRIAGDIALHTGQYEIALHRFRQSIAREPGGWFAWLGAGLAASELHEVARAHHDFEVARSIDNQQPAVTMALARVDTNHPLTAEQALNMLILVQ
jgi:hypothetical protein